MKWLVLIFILFLNLSNGYSLESKISEFINLEQAREIYKSLPLHREVRLGIHDVSFFGHKILLKEKLLDSVDSPELNLVGAHGVFVSQVIVDEELGVLGDQKIASLTQGIFIEDYKAAIKAWKQKNIKVLHASMSFRNEKIIKLLNTFIDDGGIVIVSSGNSGERLGTDLAEQYNTFKGITVGACNLKGEMEAFSQYRKGKTILAPGSVDAVTLKHLKYKSPIGQIDPAYLTSDFSIGTRGFGMTSLAAPIVTGVVLMSLRVDPSLKQADVNTLLLKSARTIQGKPVFDAEKYMQLVRNRLN